MERLTASGVKLVLVTGRPVGWGDCWLRTLPVEAVIAENGGVCLSWDRQGRFRKTYAQPTAERLRQRRRLLRAVRSALERVPGARLSTDSPYTEVNVEA